MNYEKCTANHEIFLNPTACRIDWNLSLQLDSTTQSKNILDNNSDNVEASTMSTENINFDVDDVNNIIHVQVKSTRKQNLEIIVSEKNKIINE